MLNCRKIIAVLIALSFPTLPILAGPVGVVPGRILVKAKATAGPNEIADQIKAFNGAETGEIHGLGVKILQVPERAWAAALDGLQHNPHIEFAEPDFIIAPDAIPNDSYYSSQWHLPKIHADTGWDVTTGSSGVIIAVLDTGVESSHPDLAGQLVAGWNFYDGNSDTSDVYGHGTAVAGTAAAASNNGAGVAGVAWGCKIMPVRISDPNGYAYDSTIAQGLNWAADHGARVANISFRVSDSSTVKSAAQYFQSKGGVVAVSAGNDGLFDSASDNPYVLTVSATDSNDAVTSWSNTGNNIDLAAPGLNVLTTATGASYAWWSGTSFSAPIVSGAAALVLSVQPGLSGAQAANILKSSADDLGAAGFDTQYGWGRVNVSRAVNLALSTPVATADVTAPVVLITSPVEGASISSTTYVYVNATDNAGVTRVNLFVDGRSVGYSTTAPFTIRWNSRKISAGAHQLQTSASDAAGNVGWSQIVTVYK